MAHIFIMKIEKQTVHHVLLYIHNATLYSTRTNKSIPRFDIQTHV
jgi:hypothetical protein